MVKHGISRAYGAGCRCELCVEAHAKVANRWYWKNREYVQSREQERRLAERRRCMFCESPADTKRHYCASVECIAKWKARDVLRKKIARLKRKANFPEAIREQGRLSRAGRPRWRTVYSMTADAFNEMVARQKGFCAICQRHGLRLNIDHDHVSDKVRGLLCGSCNRALGLLGDSPVTARSALRYLEGHGAVGRYHHLVGWRGGLQVFDEGGPGEQEAAGAAVVQVRRDVQRAGRR